MTTLEIVPNAPLTTGTTVVSRNFQMHLNSRFSSWYQFLHFLFLSECLSQLWSGARVSIGQKTSYQTLPSWLNSKRAHPPGHFKPHRTARPHHRHCQLFGKKMTNARQIGSYTMLCLLCLTLLSVLVLLLLLPL